MRTLIGALVVATATLAGTTADGAASRGRQTAFQAVDAAIVYVLGANGNLWREFGTYNNTQHPRALVDTNVRAFQALDSETVYVLGVNGNLWREFETYNNPQHPRVLVDSNVAVPDAATVETMDAVPPGPGLGMPRPPR